MTAVDTELDQPRATSTAKHFLPGIEVLRGVAAGAVVFHHSWALSTQPHFFGYKIIEGFGNWGVDLFFFLSGFLLCDYFWQSREKWSVRSFYIRRVFRIVPAYYANIFVLFVFFAPHALLFSAQGIKQVAANVTFTHWLFPNTASSFNVNGALWTLSIEMMLYALMPVLALAMRYRPRLAFTTMLGGGIAYRLYVAFRGGGLTHAYFGPHGSLEPVERLFLIRQFIGVLPLFAIGIGLRWLLVHDKIPVPFLTRDNPHFSVAVLVACLVPSLMCLVVIERASDYRHPLFFAFFEPVLVTVMVPALLYAARPVSRPLHRTGKLGLWLGERSYGLYLWHFPVILSVYGRGPELQPPALSYIGVRLVLIWVLAITLAAASYSTIEKPAREFGRRLSRTKASPPAPAGSSRG